MKLHETAQPTLTTLSIPKDIEISTEREFPSAKKLYITTKLPPNVAILHIYPHGQDKYCVRGGHADEKLNPTQPEQEPLWLAWVGEQMPTLEEVWQLYLRRFPVDHWYKFLKQRLDCSETKYSQAM